MLRNRDQYFIVSFVTFVVKTVFVSSLQTLQMQKPLRVPSQDTIEIAGW